MLETGDVMANPWYGLILFADLMLIFATVRLVVRSDQFRRQWPWILLAIIWPILVIILASPKFQRKWLWVAFSVIMPSISFGAGQSKHLFSSPIPIDLAFSGSISIAAIIIVGWWFWGPEETRRVSTNPKASANE